MQVMALFGGSFNPPTLAHRLVVETIKAALPAVPIVLLPAPRVAHKDPASLASFYHRVRMTEMMVADLDDVTVSEFSNIVDSPQTVELLEAWRKAHNNTHIVWLMGADSFASLPQWDGWEDIMRNTALYVMARKDQIDSVHHTHPAQQFAALEVKSSAQLVTQNGWYVDTHFHAPFSATAVRTALARGEASPYLAATVAEYIAAHSLYR